MINASVVGYGAVGKATAKAFGIKKYYDIKKSTATLKECAKTSFIFICLPTPTLPNGDQDLKIIKDVLQTISGFSRTPTIVMRSTVIPGTAKALSACYKMEVISFPEFGNEATMEKDIKYPLMTVVGAENKQPALALLEYYQQPSTILTDTVTAETIKYACNAFYALKVIYANLIYDICQNNGADYGLIKDNVFEQHPWFGKNHWEVWHKGYRGFGGKCLPKDVKAFDGYFPNSLLKSVMLMNEDFRNKKRDE